MSDPVVPVAETASDSEAAAIPAPLLEEPVPAPATSEGGRRHRKSRRKNRRSKSRCRKSRHRKSRHHKSRRH